MAGIALFGRQTQIAAAMWTSLAASSYGMYYVHPLFVYPLAYIFRSLSFPLVAKAFVVIVLSILLSWACSALLLRRAPVLRRMFSGSD
jgi:glucan biosynthesis protein C